MSRRLRRARRRFRLSAGQRARILAAAKITPDSSAYFVPGLELDLHLLAIGRHRWDARRRFAASLASCLDGLGINVGRGRSGPFYNALAACFSVVGIALKDLKPYADFGVAAVDPGDAHIERLAISPSERVVVREEQQDRKQAVKRNRVARRNQAAGKTLKQR